MTIAYIYLYGSCISMSATDSALATSSRVFSGVVFRWLLQQIEARDRERKPPNMQQVHRWIIRIVNNKSIKPHRLLLIYSAACRRPKRTTFMQFDARKKNFRIFQSFFSQNSINSIALLSANMLWLFLWYRSYMGPMWKYGYQMEILVLYGPICACW